MEGWEKSVDRCVICSVVRRSHPTNGAHDFTESGCGHSNHIASGIDCRVQQFGSQVQKWADPAMFTAVPIAEEGELIKPQVTLISMTANPLRVIAAVNDMYRGVPQTDLSKITKQQALDAFAAVSRSLEAPLEWVDFSFFIEGVARDWTHQAVRQRTAAFAQESLRFAVKENVVNDVVTPPYIEALPEDHPQRIIWHDHVARTAWVYNALVNGGMPAEEARKGLLIGTATRMHYHTDLRNLAGHSGMRLCSQAQFDWKQVWAEIVQAILNYGPESERWQQREIVRLFKPICYQIGRCKFMAPNDRWCVIRDRVEAHHTNGEPPETWSDINPLEPLHLEAARGNF